MSDSSDPLNLEVEWPMPQDLKVGGDQPYMTLLIADFAGEGGTLSGRLAEGVTEVSSDNFDAVMAEAAPTLTVKLADPLSSGGTLTVLDLRFDSTRSFNPEPLAAQIPQTQALMKLREQLTGRMKGSVTSTQLQAAVSSAVASDASLAWIKETLAWAPAAPSPEQAGAVVDLLGQLDLGDGAAAAPPPKSTIGKMVAAAAGAGASLPAEEASSIRRTLAELDRRVAAWLTAVLHHPPVQALESAWRSLAFLVSKTEFRKGLRLRAMHAPRAELTARLVSGLIDPVFDEGADSPDLIAVDAAFGHQQADVEVLDELAQHGASLPAEVFATAAPSFFGVKHAWQIPTLPGLETMFDQWQYAKWKALRGQPYARALGLFFGRALLRTPHESGRDADLAFRYKEECLTDKDLLWMSGSVVAAVAIAQSVAEVGWPTRIHGHVYGRVEGFATATGGPKGDKQFGPTDTLIPQPKVEELARTGLNIVTGLKDHHDAVVWNGFTAARPQRNERDAVFEVTLPYQLFASRLSVLLLSLKPHLVGQGAEQIQADVAAHVRKWLGSEAQAFAGELSVQTRPAEGSAGIDLAVTVTPPPEILPGGVPVVLGYRIG